MDPESAVLQANAAFTKNLYEILSRQKGNILFSPISLHAVLSMLYQGARGDTAQVLADTLKNPDINTTSEGYRAIIRRLNAVQQVTLLMANKIYGTQNKFEFLDEFKKNIVENFDGAVELLDINDPRQAAKSVNEWVEGRTKKSINNIVNEALFSKTLSLVAVTALYFKGEWVSKFKDSFTKSEQFWVDEKTTIEVKMMYQKRCYYYKEYDDLGAQVLEIPYKGYDVKMLILLPTDKNIETLEEKLLHSDIKKIGKDLQLTEVQLFLPKFKMEENTNFNNILSEMGLKTIFDVNTADFSGLLENPSLQNNLCITNVIQKTYIEVDEGGTIAASVTKAAVGVGLAPGMPKPVIFRVDHPAIFFLLASHGEEKNLSNILFYGRLSYPEH